MQITKWTQLFSYETFEKTHYLFTINECVLLKRKLNNQLAIT